MTNTPHDAIRSDLHARIAERLDDIMRTYYDDLPESFDRLTDMLALLDADDPIRHRIALSAEICPIHLCDEQICADDDDQSCAAARA